MTQPDNQMYYFPVRGNVKQDVVVDEHGHETYARIDITLDDLKVREGGDLFAFVMDNVQGVPVARAKDPRILILSTMGGLPKPDGSLPPSALSFHTGSSELHELVNAAGEVLWHRRYLPFSANVSDPCDGRTQGTLGMTYSLASRAFMAQVLQIQAGSLPGAQGFVVIASCDKGLPAAIEALVAQHNRPGVLVPGGVMLDSEGDWDTANVQGIGSLGTRGQITVDEAQEAACTACGSSGGSCQFLGTAATTQVVAEAMGITLTHAALAPSGLEIWKQMARDSAEAMANLVEHNKKHKKHPENQITMDTIVTRASIRNAMVIHAAFGGSTNLLMHIGAIAHAAGLPIPTYEEWQEVNRTTPRLVDVKPNGPEGHATIMAFMAGGVPEVMLHLRKLGLLDTSCMTVTGHTLGENLDEWEKSDRRAILRDRLRNEVGIDPDTVIYSPEKAKERGLTGTITLVKGNIAPDWAVIKSTAIDASVVGEDGIYRNTGPARVFTTEASAIKAIKEGKVGPKDIVILMGTGPKGSGMVETFQITNALKLLDGQHNALITDGRFSGVSTGPCFAHVGPEALEGGPLGKLRNGDMIEIIVDRNNLTGSINFVGTKGNICTPEEGARRLALRKPHPKLRPDPRLTAPTIIFGAINNGVKNGATFDEVEIDASMTLAKAVLAETHTGDMQSNEAKLKLADAILEAVLQHDQQVEKGNRARMRA